ncbi:hypothetical protein L0636_07765 [Halomonas janggokensis]|uniref:Uncharacterized protein n=1 Tax=Vreelandella subterranea TaxID=416874 RepID=A0A1H9WFX4_9GAMM|nr:MULTISPECIES: hypothetical protein [Halomonas]MCZ0930319.1 hypothetical protein [Halomonas janggokensis]SES32832.1 hypothetical protein SAMN04487958_11498 [Halomonas subterranea]
MATLTLTMFVPKTQTTLFRGVDVELERCAEGTRRDIETALKRGTQTPNPLADIEALEERTTAEAVGQLATSMLAAGKSDEAVEDALSSLNAHLDEHFLQRKLVRLYER